MTGINLCRRRGCCPTISYDGKHYVIEDDYGGSIKICEKHISELKEMLSLIGFE
jgi:hypothetical protein